MATTTLTHKVRNPRKLNEWLNIWTANVTQEGNSTTIEVTPSENWKIPITQLIAGSGNNSTLPAGLMVPVNQVSEIIDNNTNVTTHNVTTNSPYSENALTKFDSNGNLVAGPVIDSQNGGTNICLNQRGEWVAIVHPVNSASVAGIVSAGGNNNKNKVWGTDSNGNPAWKKIETNDINDGAITTNKINDSAVTSAKIENGTIKTEDLALNDEDSQGNKTFIIPAANIDTIPANKISNLNNTINDAINTNINTINQNGVVIAGSGHNNKVWRTDGSGNPGWAQITGNHINNTITDANIATNAGIDPSKIDTLLLGVWIASQDSNNPRENGSFAALGTASSWDNEHCGIWVEI